MGSVAKKPKHLISHDFLHKLQSKYDLPDAKIFGISSDLREECGKNIIEPGYVKEIKGNGKNFEKYFSVEEIEFTVSRKREKPKKGIEYFQENRNLVYCHDIDGFEQEIREARGIPKEKKLRHQWGIDGGGDHFKVCLNLIDESVDPNAPGNSKKHLDSSVCASLIVAIVEHIPEVYGNVKLIMEKLNLSTDKIEFHMASDLKLINIIGQSKS